jgi:glycosyltransferase involved in cell wall biosynthesis
LRDSVLKSRCKLATALRTVKLLEPLACGRSVGRLRDWSLAVHRTTLNHISSESVLEFLRAAGYEHQQLAMLKITIVTPSFNQARYLPQTIDSVLSQNYPNLEYLIMDGGSKDASVEVIKKYERHLAYWTSGPDGGQTNAINSGFQRATGDIVTWLNSDDYLEPDALQTIAEAFAHTDAGVVYGDYTLVTEAGRPFLRRKEIPFDFKILLYGINFIGQPSAYFRRQLLLEHGYLDEHCQCMMDFEFWLRLASRGVKFQLLPKNLSYYRYHPTSKTVSEVDTILKETNEVRARYSPALSRAALRRRRLLARVKRQWIKLIQRGTIDYFGGPLRWVAYRWRQ